MRVWLFVLIFLCVLALLFLGKGWNFYEDEKCGCKLPPEDTKWTEVEENYAECSETNLLYVN